MARNPYWTAQDALTVVSLAQLGHAATMTFAPSPGTTFENVGTISGSVTSTTYSFAPLRSDAEYTFLATGTYQVRLSIYDSQGYLLLFTDGDDAGAFDPYPTDSIVRFRPEASGNYYLSVSYENVSANGSYSIRASEDIGADGKNTPTASPSVTATITTAYQNILRTAPTGADTAFVGDLSLKVTYGTLSLSQAYDQIIQKADATTSVATLAYEFFTGKIPSEAGMDFLVSPSGPNANNLNSAYYQSFNIENRFINFAVNLGKLGEGQAKFQADYGSKSLFDTMASAYKTIFGSTPTDTKVHALLDPRADYFAYYGQDGGNGIGTKAAAVGWLLAEAVKADVGTMQVANMFFLEDLANGATFAVDIVGVYKGVPYLG